MASKEADAKLIIGADDAPFQEAMKNVQKTAQEAMSRVGGHIEGLTGVLSKVSGAFAAFAATIGAAAGLKSSIDATVKFTGEVNTLSKQLGITTEEASGLNVALGDVGSDAGTYTDALGKLTRQVRQNEAGLNAMGIATRDSNGEYLNGKALMDSALTGLKSYKEGTDRNLAAQVAFGKGAQEAAALQKLNIQIQEEAKKKADELGLVVGTKNVAAVKAYKLALNDMDDVLLAMGKVVGDAVMPVVTKLANWFAEGGPAAVRIFKDVAAGIADVLSMVADLFIEVWDKAKEAFTGILEALNLGDTGVQSFGEFVRNVFTVIKTILLTFKLVFVETFDVAIGMVKALMVTLSTFASVATAVFRLDFAGAEAAWKNGMAKLEKIVADTTQRVKDNAAKIGGQIKELIDPTTTRGRRADLYSDAMYGPAADKKLKSWGGEGTQSGKAGRLEDTSKAEYAVAKAQFEAALALQKEYLKEAQAAYDDAYRNNLVDIKGYFAAKRAIEEQQFDLEMEAKRKEIAATLQAQSTSTTDRERLTLKAQEIKLTGELTVLEAQRAQVAISTGRQMTEALRTQYQALEQIKIQSQINSGNAAIAMDRINLDTRRRLRQVSDAQSIEEERGFEDRITAIQRDAILQRLQMEQQGSRDPVKIAELNAQLESLERDHQLRITQIEADATVERKKYQIEVVDSIRGSFSTLLSDLTDKSKKMSDVFKNFATSVQKSINDALSKKFTDQLLGAGTTGGGILDQVVGAVLGTGSTATTRAGAGAAKDDDAATAASTAAAAALDGLTTSTASTSTGMQGLGTQGIGGMAGGIVQWVQKNVLGIASEQVRTTATSTSATVVSTFTAAVTAASQQLTAFAANLASTSATSGSSSSSGSLFGSLLGGAGKAAGSSGSTGGLFGAGAEDIAAFESIPAFAQGTDFVPRDMLAMIHKGERITPAKYNNSNDNRKVIVNQTVNVPATINRASAGQTAGAVAVATSQAARRNS